MDVQASTTTHRSGNMDYKLQQQHTGVVIWTTSFNNNTQEW